MKNGVAIRALILFIIALMVMPASAQEAPTFTADRPLVVFIDEEESLDTASLGDTGSDGVSRLGEIFEDLGAQVESVGLSTALPPETDVIVLIRPLRGLSAAALARLYAQIQRGANVLLAIDPAGQQDAQNDGQNSALASLINADYGIRLLDGFLAAPYFTLDSIRDVRTSFLQAYPVIGISDPLFASLSQYDAPLQIWGARPLSVTPFTSESIAAPLIYGDAPFAEANTSVFGGGEREARQSTRRNNRNNTAPAAPPIIELNIGTDPQGVLPIGAISENRTNGSRLALFTDGELFLNEFGLAVGAGSRPVYPGNRLLVDRVATWMLELDAAAAPPLSEDITWIALDGEGDDFPDSVTAVNDDDEGGTAVDMTSIAAFSNNSFVYLFITTGSPPDGTEVVTVEFDSDANSTSDITISLQSGGVIAQAGDALLAIEDAAVAFGNTGIEVRVPLRIVGVARNLASACVSIGAAQDCFDGQVSITALDLEDAAPLRFTGTMLANVVTADVANIRAAPNTSSERVASVRNGELFAAVGRNEAGDWVRVENAAYSGWMADFLLRLNGDVNALPVVE